MERRVPRSWSAHAEGSAGEGDGGKSHIIGLDDMEVQKKVLCGEKILWSLRCLWQVPKAKRISYKI